MNVNNLNYSNDLKKILLSRKSSAFSRRKNSAEESTNSKKSSKSFMIEKDKDLVRGVSLQKEKTDKKNFSLSLSERPG